MLFLVRQMNAFDTNIYVVVQIYPWFKFYLPVVLGYGNEGK